MRRTDSHIYSRTLVGFCVADRDESPITRDIEAVSELRLWTIVRSLVIVPFLSTRAPRGGEAMQCAIPEVPGS